jgi:hypothetical protein
VTLSTNGKNEDTDSPSRIDGLHRSQSYIKALFIIPKELEFWSRLCLGLWILPSLRDHLLWSQRRLPHPKKPLLQHNHFWGKMDIQGICFLALGAGTAMTFYAFIVSPSSIGFTGGSTSFKQLELSSLCLILVVVAR